MAKRKAKPTPRGGASARPAASGRKFGAFGIVGSLVVLFALVLAPASFIVALVALAPSLVYAVIERRNKEAVHCVTAFNLTGMMPVLGILWGGENSLVGAIALLSNPLSWLVMYGSVVVALAFLSILPKGAAFVLETRAAREAAAFRRAQERLEREWGEGIKSAPNAAAKPKPSPRRRAPAPRATSADVLAR